MRFEELTREIVALRHAVRTTCGSGWVKRFGIWDLGMRILDRTPQRQIRNLKSAIRNRTTHPLPQVVLTKPFAAGGAKVQKVAHATMGRRTNRKVLRFASGNNRAHCFVNCALASSGVEQVWRQVKLNVGIEKV